MLGESRNRHDYILTVPGRGYRFVAGVRQTFDEVFVHTLSRIVVEEEVDGGQTVGEDVIAPTNLAPLSQGETVHGEVVYSTAQAATSTTIAPLVQSRHQKIVLLVAALVGLLFTTGVGSYWLYRNRSHASVIPTPAPRQLMTITRITDGRHLGASSISPDGKFIAYIENAFVGQARSSSIRLTPTLCCDCLSRLTESSAA